MKFPLQRISTRLFGHQRNPDRVELQEIAIVSIRSAERDVSTGQIQELRFK